ncbi:MAG: hypothetical protein ACRDYV_10490, partial [Acidimicrobiia bacterium]
MTGPRRTRGVLALAGLVATLGLSGCSSEATTIEKNLRAALSATEHLSHRFVYKETFVAEEATQATDVRGLVEDDLRYKARVSV